VSDLKDLPRQISSLFSGNSSRFQHLLFNDVASNFDGISSKKDFIINFISCKSVDERKIDLELWSERNL
jgi:hypothetical protein